MWEGPQILLSSLEKMTCKTEDSAENSLSPIHRNITVSFPSHLLLQVLQSSSSFSSAVVPAAIHNQLRIKILLYQLPPQDCDVSFLKPYPGFAGSFLLVHHLTEESC